MSIKKYCPEQWVRLEVHFALQWVQMDRGLLVINVAYTNPICGPTLRTHHSNISIHNTRSFETRRHDILTNVSPLVCTHRWRQYYSFTISCLESRTKCGIVSHLLDFIISNITRVVVRSFIRSSIISVFRSSDCLFFDSVMSFVALTLFHSFVSKYHCNTSSLKNDLNHTVIH